MQHITSRLKKFSLVFSFCFITVLSFAQAPVDPGDDPGGDPIAPGGGVPVDGGLGILLVAGIGYGAKKAHEHRKKIKMK